MIGKMLLRISCASACILWALPCSGLELDPDEVSWSRLSFEFSEGGKSVTTEIHLESVPATELGNSLAPIPDDAVMPAAETDVWLLTAEISGARRFLFIPQEGSWQTQVWFLPGTASPLRRMRWKFGDEPYVKTYHYAKDRAYRQRLEPDDRSEADGGPENWTKIKNSIYPLSPAPFDCPGISDTSLLLYILTTIPFSERAKPLHLCLFNKKALYDVEFRAMGLERLKVSYVAKLEDAESKVTEEIDSLRVLVTARAEMVAGGELEPFEVLKLRGDIEIFLDKTARLPVRIRGTVPDLGDIDLRLTEATLSKAKAELMR